MADYSTEIAALKSAIATGIRTITQGDTTTTYDTFEAMMKRLAWLENQNVSAATGAKAGFAAFDRGDC